jgi:hypothetical protein
VNSYDLELLSQSWGEPELARVTSDFVRRNGRLPRRPELLETLTDNELLTQPGPLQAEQPVDRGLR